MPVPRPAALDSTPEEAYPPLKALQFHAPTTLLSTPARTHTWQLGAEGVAEAQVVWHAAPMQIRSATREGRARTPRPAPPVFISVVLPTVTGGQALLAGGEAEGGVQAVAPVTITNAAASATTTLALRITILEIVCFITVIYGHSTRTSIVVPRPATLELVSLPEDTALPLKEVHCSLPYWPLCVPPRMQMRQLGTTCGHAVRQPSVRHICSATSVVAPRSPDFI